MQIPTSAGDLDPERCLGLLKEGHYAPQEWRFSKDDEIFNLLPQGRIAYNNSYALIRSALQGVGFIYVLDVFVNKYLRSGELVEVLHDWDTSSRTFHAVTHKTRFVSAKVRVFLEFLSEVLDAQRRGRPQGAVAIRAGRAGRRAAARRTKTRSERAGVAKRV